MSAQRVAEAQDFETVAAQVADQMTFTSIFAASDMPSGISLSRNKHSTTGPVA
jgi:hypothetical protein